MAAGSVPNTQVRCVEEHCELVCFHDYYDVDGDPDNGCETRDDDKGHTLGAAVDLGTKGCDNAESSTRFSGRIVSDARAHDPVPDGFDATTGSAPDFWRVFASGGFGCERNLNASIMTTGGGPGICYRLTVRSGAGFTYGTANVSGNGFAGIQTATYPADADIIFKIEKTCDTTVRENITYTVDFHL